jgi:ABC-type uncharacterized transport system permease subunit
LHLAHLAREAVQVGQRRGIEDQVAFVHGHAAAGLVEEGPAFEQDYLLLRSRHGLALTAMRDNTVAAASQGVDVGRLKFMVFLAAAVGTGLVGAVYYLNALRLSPNAGFDPNWTSIAIFMG